jgi:hypothetical protein
MPFTSRLHGLRVFDEHTANRLVDQSLAASGGGFFSGYKPRDFAAAPFGTYSDPFALDLIPRNEWAERAEALDSSKATAEHVAMYYKVPILNQRTLPYCWCYGVVGAMATAYAQAGLPVGYLSATSAAAKIKNYVKVGGWAGEAIEGIQRFGVSMVEHWPEAVLDRRYDTPEQRENAALHKAVEIRGIAEPIVRCRGHRVVIRFSGYSRFGVVGPFGLCHPIGGFRPQSIWRDYPQQLGARLGNQRHRGVG